MLGAIYFYSNEEVLFTQIGEGLNNLWRILISPSEQKYQLRMGSTSLGTNYLFSGRYCEKVCAQSKYRNLTRF